MFVTKKELELNNSFLEELVAESRLNDMSKNVSYKESQMRDRNASINEWYEDMNQKPAFNLITKIAFTLKCRCSFSWTYQPRNYDARRKYALCPKCRQAVRIHNNQDQIPLKRGRKTKESI